MRSTRRCSMSSRRSSPAWPATTTVQGRGAARQRPPLLHRRRSRIARRRRRRCSTGAACHVAGRARGTRRAAEADDRGRARRRGRRRRRLCGLLRRRHRGRHRVLLDPGSARRHGAARRDAVSHPRHGPSQLPPLRACRANAFRRPSRSASGWRTRSANAAQLDDTLARIADDLLHGAPGAMRELKQASDRFAVPSLAAHARRQAGTAWPAVRGGARRHRELPREAQTELVSAVNSGREAVRADRLRRRRHLALPVETQDMEGGKSVAARTA